MIIHGLNKNAYTYAYDIKSEECKWIQHTGKEDDMYVAIANVERYRKISNIADIWHYPWEDNGCDALLFAKDIEDIYAIETKNGDRYYFKEGMIYYAGYEE